MDPPDPTLDPQAQTDDVVEDVVEDSLDDAQARLWLRAVTGSAETLAKMVDSTITDARVQFAIDRAIVAACERIGRLCRSDLEDS